MEAVLVARTNPLRSHQRSSAEFHATTVMTNIAMEGSHGPYFQMIFPANESSISSIDFWDFPKSYVSHNQMVIWMCRRVSNKAADMPCLSGKNAKRNRCHFPYSRIAISFFHLWHTPLL